MSDASYLFYEERDFVVWYKESGIPTVPLKRKEERTLLNIAAEYSKEVLEPYGEHPWEGSTIHRLDTNTKGLVLFAKSKECYDYLKTIQKEGKIVKEYIARVCEVSSLLPGFPSFTDKNPIVSAFRPYGPGGKAVRPILEGIQYSTLITGKEENTYYIKITKGFRHQIRCHLAWSAHPIIGDALYGGAENDEFGLEAISISFVDNRGIKRDIGGIG